MTTPPEVPRPTAGRALRAWNSIRGPVLGAAAIAIGGRFEIPVPGSPVPVSLQTLAVLVAAGLLGPGRGAAAVGAYLAAGAAGLPVFAGGAGGLATLAGPTGGYLFAMALAAWGYGFAVRRRGFRAALSAALVAHVAILAIGAARLSAFSPAAGVWSAGVLPFLPGGAVKSLAAAGVHASRRYFERRR